ncbi:MAG: PEP-CTERM sorting domain-containing protein [Burkholderiales bacterium]|nr:PEP-CTERM sorting domain-containing protein [Phycisphaerae bacterium]
MRQYSLTALCTASTLLMTAGMCVNDASAASFVPLGSGVQRYFGSQSNAYTDSVPAAAWGAVPIGPYTAGSTITGVPAAPGSTIYPTYNGLPFQTTPSSWQFIDTFAGTAAFTASRSTIAGSFNPTGTLTSDAEVNIFNWHIEQGPAATGYAYEQLNFGSGYGVTANPTGLGGATPALPLPISGIVQAGGYAQFDAVINYAWIPTTPLFVPTGPAVSLGSLSYTFLQPGGGTFSTGTLLASPIGDGILELSGHMWVAGDPFDMTVGPLPEPTSLAVLAIGAMAMLRRRTKA